MTKADSKIIAAAGTTEYDPFIRGRFTAGVRAIEALDIFRDRLFPCEIWYPAAAEYTGQDLVPETQDLFTVPPGSVRRRQMATRNASARPGTYPLIIFSHSSGGNRLQSTFLCTHLASHGYVVAALDHSEIVATELARKDGESAEQKTARAEAWIGNRVPDVRFLVDHLLGTTVFGSELNLDHSLIGIVGHSFGGWTALAAPDLDAHIRAVVALAPAGASLRKPGILPVNLIFNWGRDVSTLYLVAENDSALPLAGMYELFERTPATKQMVILRRADHLHFMDHVEELHEAVRKMPYPGSEEMRPIAELCSGEQAHLFIRGLTLSHMDATLLRREQAQRFLTGDLKTELSQRGVDVFVHNVEARQPL